MRRRSGVLALGVTGRWWGLAVVVGGVMAVVPGWAQVGSQVPGTAPAVPEVVNPSTSAPTLPQGNDDTLTPVPRSDNSQVGGGGARPVPDNGVIAPPVPGAGSAMVIKPPVTGSMPVIRPPGTSGGVGGGVPK